MVNFMTVRIDDKKCDHCLECVSTCPNGALTYYRAYFGNYKSKAKAEQRVKQLKENNWEGLL